MHLYFVWRKNIDLPFRLFCGEKSVQRGERSKGKAITRIQHEGQTPRKTQRTVMSTEKFQTYSQMQAVKNANDAVEETVSSSKH